jgi:hypothetical protein
MPRADPAVPAYAPVLRPYEDHGVAAIRAALLGLHSRAAGGQ